MGVYSDEVRTENLRSGLSNTNDLMHIFLEWRHKVMVRFAVAVGAVVVALSTIPPADERLRATVLGVGSAFAFVAWRLDIVNQRLLREQVYETGARLEAELRLPNGAGIFTAMQERAATKRWWNPTTYHQVLQLSYVLGALAMGAGAVYHLCKS